MQGTECARELADILNGLKTIQSCGHGPEVEARYRDHTGFRFQMCRQCWSDETYHRISKDSVQVIRPNQLGVIVAKCMACNSRNGFLQVRGIGCRAGGVPALRRGRCGAKGPYEVLSGTLNG